MNGPDTKKNPEELDNVIIFPKTIDYYQIEITRMLETERYGEAIATLKFLLGCRGVDQSAVKEWSGLLAWLESMFIDSDSAWTNQPIEDEEEVTEQGLLHMHISGRAENDNRYVERLLSSLMSETKPDKQLLALEQLVFLHDPAIDDTLLAWLKASALHPTVQFKALQVLRRRGITGLVELVKWKETILLNIEDTPADMESFPSQIHDIVSRIEQISEINQPELAYFAKEMWSEFLYFVYGTSVYRQMLIQDQACTDVWASALHLVLQEAIFQTGNKEEVLDMYGITADLKLQWEQAYRIIRQYVTMAAL